MRIRKGGQRARGIRNVVAGLSDLAVPLECGGCGTPGTGWCAVCDVAIDDVPVRVSPSLNLPVPAWALGRYSGTLRQAILELKEHRRRDLAPVLGRGIAGALIALAEWGEIPAGTRGIALIPAPSRFWAARRRGGDPVTAIASHTARLLGPRVRVLPLLRTAYWARDSAGLGATARAANLRDAIGIRSRPPPGLRREDIAAILVDDVLTTGATAAASARVLHAAGIDLTAVLVLAAA